MSFLHFGWLRMSAESETAKMLHVRGLEFFLDDCQVSGGDVSTPVESRTMVFFPGTEEIQSMVVARLADRFRSPNPLTKLSSLKGLGGLRFCLV